MELEQQTFLEIPGRDADRVKSLHQSQGALHVGRGPRAHQGDVVERRHHVAVVIEIPDDGRPDVPEALIIGEHGQLPVQVIRQRTGRRQRVFKRGQLFDFLGDSRAIPVVEVLPEEVRVVGVVPGVLLLGRGWRFGVRLLTLRRRVGLLKLFGRNLLEQRVLDDLLIQQIDQLQRRHGQQLDGLLQRGGEDEFLGELELEVEFVLKPLDHLSHHIHSASTTVAVHPHGRRVGRRVVDRLSGSAHHPGG